MMKSCMWEGVIPWSSTDWALPGSGEKALGILVGSKLTWSQQYALAAPKVDGAMHRYCQQIKSVTIPLDLAVARPHLEYCVPFWSTQLKRD